MTTFISVRVSTREQSLDGTSLPTQIRECLAYCRLQNFELHPDSNVSSPGVFADPGVSAWKTSLLSRPGFLEIWRRVQPGDNIVFYSIDRGFRSMKDFLTSCELFERKQVTPVFVRDGIRMDTAAGSLWAKVRAAFAEYQSAILSERLKESYAIRRQRAAEEGTKLRKGEVQPEERADSVEITEDIRRICEFSGGKVGEERKGRVFRYIRVSTGEQNPDTQRAILERHRDFYLEQGYSDGGEVIDHGVSAFYHQFRNRPAGGQLWQALQPGDLILVTRLDRIFRSTVDMGQTLREWDKQNITFADTSSGLRTDTLGGKALANFMCMMAQWESESISWRVKLAMKEIQNTSGPWTNGKVPQWVRRIPAVLSDGTKIHRLEVIPGMIQDMLHMQTLVEQGFSSQEIGDIMQREHELQEDMPVAVPRCGLGSRWGVECKLRRTERFEEAGKVRRYCEKHGIGVHDRIDRVYTTDDKQLFELVRCVRDQDTVFKRYVEVNGMRG